MQRAARSQSSMNFRDLATQKLSSRASNHSFAEGGPCQQSNQTMLNAKRGWAHATTRAETEEGLKGATCGEAASCARVKRLTCNICAHQLFLKLVSCLHWKSFTSKSNSETIGQVWICDLPVVAIDLAAPARKNFELSLFTCTPLVPEHTDILRFLVTFQKPLGFSVLRYFKLAIWQIKPNQNMGMEYGRNSVKTCHRLC